MYLFFFCYWLPCQYLVPDSFFLIPTALGRQTDDAKAVGEREGEGRDNNQKKKKKGGEAFPQHTLSFSGIMGEDDKGGERWFY